MSFLLRGAKRSDLPQIMDLAESFSLLNLPADEKILSEKVDRSIKSFKGVDVPLDEAEYFFVVEDNEKKRVVGTSLILAKHGTEEFPHTFFDLEKRERHSKELGIGYIHQVLKLKYDSDGPTEIGGLLVSETYRRRPEKIGKQISLVRFLYMAMHKEKFEKRILCELTPPLSSDGRSEFWEALGRKFTGLPYNEADYLSRHNKEFIKNLFPDEVIYTCLLEAKARYVIGRVGLSTMPAKHLLESIGFKYLNQIDPFDGGPHYGVNLEDVTLVKKTKRFEVASSEGSEFDTMALVASEGDEGFKGCLSYFSVKEKRVLLPEATQRLIGVREGDTVHLTPLSEGLL